MNNTFKPGDQVRLKVSEHRRIGTVVNIADGMVAVRYDHRPEISTHGYYPVSHLDLVAAAPAPAAAPAVKAAAPVVKPKATTADIIGGAK